MNVNHLNGAPNESDAIVMVEHGEDVCKIWEDQRWPTQGTSGARVMGDLRTSRKFWNITGAVEQS